MSHPRPGLFARIASSFRLPRNLPVPEQSTELAAPGREAVLGSLDSEAPGHTLMLGKKAPADVSRLILPVLMGDEGSAVVQDPFGFCHQHSSGMRSAHLGQRVVRWAPGDPTEACGSFNLLAEVRIGDKKEVRDVDDLWDALSAPSPGSRTPSNTERAVGKQIFRVLALQLGYTEPGCGLADMADLIQGVPLGRLLEEVCLEDHAQGRGFYWSEAEGLGPARKTHPAVAEAARQLNELPEEQLDKGISFLEQLLGPLRDPVFRRATERSDFELADLNRPGRSMTLYLVYDPDAPRVAGMLFSALVRFALRRLAEPMAYTNGAPATESANRLTFYLGELDGLPAVRGLPVLMRYSKPLRLRFVLGCAAPSSLAHYSGEPSSLAVACGMRIVMSPGSEAAAAEIAAAMGAPGAAATELLLQLPEDKLVVASKGAAMMVANKVSVLDDPQTRAWGELAPVVEGHQPLPGGFWPGIKALP